MGERKQSACCHVAAAAVCPTAACRPPTAEPAAAPVHPIHPSSPLSLIRSLVLGEIGEGGENAEPASAAHAGTSQRITPYLSKHAPRPASATKPHTPATAGKFAERQNSGAVVASLNAQLEVPAAAAGDGEAMEVDGGASRCTVQVRGRPCCASGAI